MHQYRAAAKATPISLGKYVAATPTLLANVAAWSQVDYFDPEWPVPPLLHVWSIAVEEQFYVAYPLALILCTRFWPRGRFGALAIVALASLALCVWGSTHRAIANFYLPGTRAWELLLGALVAVGPRPPPVRRALRELIAAASLAVILVATWLYRGTMDYPGLYTIPVCVAAAGLLAADASDPTRTHRLLGWRPLVYVGLLSYSLYLWHMPVLAFARYLLVAPPSPGSIVALLGIITALAYLSYALVERPIRARARLKSNRVFAYAVGIASAAIAALGVGLWSSNGLPGRFSPGVQAYASGESFDPPFKRCIRLVGEIADLDGGRFCEFGDAARPAATVVVWGDSHAFALLPAYRQLAASHGWHVVFAAHSGCKPLFAGEPREATSPWQRACDEFNRAMVRAVARLRPDVVILNSYWARQRVEFRAWPLDAKPDAELDRGRLARDAAAHRLAAADRLRRARSPHAPVCRPVRPGDRRAARHRPGLFAGQPGGGARDARRGRSADPAGRRARASAHRRSEGRTVPR